jgi:hypothetical protein
MFMLVFEESKKLLCQNWTSCQAFHTQDHSHTHLTKRIKPMRNDAHIAITASVRHMLQP